MVRIGDRGRSHLESDFAKMNERRVSVWPAYARVNVRCVSVGAFGYIVKMNASLTFGGEEEMEALRDDASTRENFLGKTGKDFPIRNSICRIYEISISRKLVRKFGPLDRNWPSKAGRENCAFLQSFSLKCGVAENSTLRLDFSFRVYSHSSLFHSMP